MTLDLGWPVALYALLLVPVFVALAIGSRYSLSPRRRVLATAARVTAVALAVLAVSDLRIGWPTERLAVAAVLDHTARIAPEERARVLSDLSTLAATTPDVDFRLPPVSAAGEAPLPASLELWARLASLPTDRVRHVLLATDGRDVDHSLASAVAAAHAAGARVDVLPLGLGPRMDDLSLAELDAPRLVRAEETLDVAATVWASADRDTSLEVFLDGSRVGTTAHHATEGDSTARLAVRFPTEPGVHELEVALSGGAGVTANDRWRSLVEVLPKPRVRIYRAADAAPTLLADVLRDAGMEVEVAPPSEAFTSVAEYDRYALVVTDEIELNDLPEAARTSLASWVQDEGGGWVNVTGNRPVRTTPRELRALEPIGPPPAAPEPRPLELIVVVDRSGSMEGSRLVQARNAAAAAVRAVLARPDALAGVVAFSDGADMVINPMPATGLQQLLSRIRGISIGGGTNIAAAISAANRAMSNDPRYIHHVVLISDGESDRPAAIAAASALAGRGVSISCITIGPSSSLLAEIARIGRGRYHNTTSGAGLTSLVLSEANYRQPPAARNTTFYPREVTHLSMFDGISFSDAPPITGHALSTLRPGATEALRATESMPLLGHWHRGLGQVATFTSSATSSWTDSFRAWSGFRAMWGALARGMLRTRPIEPPRVHVGDDPLDPDRRIVTVVSPFTDETVPPVVRLFRDRTGPTDLDLAVRGPGVFSAEIPVGFTFLVDARMPFDPEPTAAAGDERPFDPELRRFGPDVAGLERLAALGGGGILSAPAGILADVGEAHVMQSLRIPLLLLALLSYLLSLLLLRLPERMITKVAADRPSRSSIVPETRISRPPAPPKSKKEAA